MTNRAVPTSVCWLNLLEDDVEAVLGLDEADVFDDVVMMEVLEEIDLCLQLCHTRQHSPLWAPSPPSGLLIPSLVDVSRMCVRGYVCGG